MTRLIFMGCISMLLLSSCASPRIESTPHHLSGLNIQADMRFVTEEKNLMAYEGFIGGSEYYPVTLPSGTKTSNWRVRCFFGSVFHKYPRHELVKIIDLLDHEHLFVRMGAADIINRKLDGLYGTSYEFTANKYERIPMMQKVREKYKIETPRTKATQIHRTTPESEAMLQQAFKYHRLGMLDEALRQYTAVLAKSPRCAIAQVRRAEIFRTKGDLETANVEIKKAMELDDAYEPAIYEMANILLTGPFDDKGGHPILTWLMSDDEVKRRYALLAVKNAMPKTKVTAPSE